MKLNLYNFFMVFGVIFLTHHASASHALGGFIRYDNLGGSKYKLTAVAYRDCRGIKLDSARFGVYAGSNGGNACGSYAITGFTLVSIKEISLLCPKDTARCKPQNSYATGEGIEEFTYEKTIDLNKSPFSNFINKTSCCEITFSMSITARPAGSILGCSGACPDFNTTAMLNICNLKKCKETVNNSPIQFGKPIMYPPCNQQIQHSTGFSDNNKDDSLTFRLAPALAGLPNNSITYNSPFSYQYFMTPYCVPSNTIKCTPNFKTTPARGIYFDTVTGDLLVTPTKCDEVFTYVPEVYEYRKDTTGKWLEIGRSRRDYTVFVIDYSPYNKSPIISGPTINKVCAGDKLCFKIKFTDETFTPFQTVPDTVKAWWDKAIPNGTFKIIDSTSREKEAEFCWQTHDSDVRNTSYRFSAFTSDQHCTPPIVSSRTFLIRVLPKAPANISVVKNKCGGLYLNAMRDSNYQPSIKNEWSIKDTSGKVWYNSAKEKDTVYYLPKNKYIIALKSYYFISCPTIRLDTVEVGAIPQLRIGNDTFICKNGSNTLTAQIQNAKKPYNYIWQQVGNPFTLGTSTSFLVSNLSASASFNLILTDSLGCKYFDTATISINQLPIVSWSKNPLSPVCHSNACLNLNALVTSPENRLRTANNFRIWGTSNNYKPLGYVDSIYKGSNQENVFNFNCKKIDNQKDLSGGKFLEETLVVWFQDSNGCANTAITKQRVYGNPIIVLDTSYYCQDQGYIKLDSSVIRPKVKFGTKQTWRILSAPKNIDTSNLVGDRSGGLGTDWELIFGTKDQNQYAGKYHLEFMVKDAVTGCFSKDSTDVIVIAEPLLKSTDPAPQCSKVLQYDLKNIFSTDGTKPTAKNSKFSLCSFNDSVQSLSFGDAKIDGQYFSASKFGKWRFLVENWETGCLSMDTFSLLSKATPKANFTVSPADSLPKNNPVFQLFNNSTIASGDSLKYLWYFDFPYNLDSTKTKSPTQTYASIDSNYTIQLTAFSQWCADTVRKKVIVGLGHWNSVDIPKQVEFHLNNQFQIAGVEFSKIRMLIYSADGKLVQDLNHNQGIQLTPGIYIYKIQLQTQGKATIQWVGRQLILPQ